MSQISKFFPPPDELLGPGVRVLDEGAGGVFGLSKPAGVLSHPNRPEDRDRSLIRLPYDPEKEAYEGDGRLWSLLNRLDVGTSGVVLVAAGQKVAAAIRDAFAEREVRKLYVALVFGRPTSAKDQWKDRLLVRRIRGRIRTAPGGSLIAESGMRLLRTAMGTEVVSQLELRPRTGRSHQLRVQCAQRRLPIVGDPVYGDFTRNREFARKTGIKRMFLHASATEVAYPWNGRRAVFSVTEDPPPEFFLPWAAK